MQQLTPNLKLITIIAIWLIAGVFSIVQALLIPAGFFNLIMMIVLFGMAMGATGMVFHYMDESRNSNKNANRDRDEREYSHTATDKRKNDQAGGLSPDMLALLNEDDLDELRQRVKERLMERIEGGGDGELSSLDALLADQDTSKRKARR